MVNGQYLSPSACGEFSNLRMYNSKKLVALPAQSYPFQKIVGPSSSITPPPTHQRFNPPNHQSVQSSLAHLVIVREINQCLFPTSVEYERKVRKRTRPILRSARSPISPCYAAYPVPDLLLCARARISITLRISSSGVCSSPLARYQTD